MDMIDPLADLEVNTNVMTALRAWRSTEARRQEIPAYWILSNRMLTTLAHHCPVAIEDMDGIPGLGRGRIQKYGEAIIGVIQEAMSSRGTLIQGSVPERGTSAELTQADVIAVPESTMLESVTYRIPADRIEAVLTAT